MARPFSRRPRRSRTLVVLLLLLAALVASGLYLRANYDVTGTVIWTATDLAAIHTTRMEATGPEMDALIAEARLSLGPREAPRPTRGPLRVHPDNPRYFQAADGEAVYLTGSHTWSNFQDNGGSDPPPVFDFQQHLDFLDAHGHNFTRLWVWEGSRWSVQTRDDNYWFHPEAPFVRTGPGTALDGKPRWDLGQFDDAWFERLRARVEAAREKGIYVAVMLFNGWSVAGEKGGLSARNPWHGHPFNAANNINGVDGDPNGDDTGLAIHELGNPDALAIQEAYVRKVVDTLNDLDNVLYEVSNESHFGSIAWQHHIIDHLQDYQATLPLQHPVGMTVTFPKGDNDALFASNAEWISPRGYRDPPPSDGTSVIIADTDHLWGIGGDRAWVWKSLTRGAHPIFMDGYDAAGYGAGGKAFPWKDPAWASLRINMGYTRHYAERLDLATAEPDPDACSTGYCLLAGEEQGWELLVYAPDGGEFSVDLADVDGTVSGEWFDPATGDTASAGDIDGGGSRTLTPPFGADAVLHLHHSPGP